MNTAIEKNQFTGKRFVILGLGSIASGLLPLLLERHGVSAGDIMVITAPTSNGYVAQQYGIRLINQPLTADNYVLMLDSFLNAGDILLNLATNVSAIELLQYCGSRGIHYVDTSNETWPDQKVEAWNTEKRRQRMLEMARRREITTSSVLYHGANPGLVSHFVKAALLEIAIDSGMTVPAGGNGRWSRLAKDLDVRAIHISELDTQRAHVSREPGQFVSTWSPGGFMFEAAEFSNFAWGTHEVPLPAGYVRSLDAPPGHCRAIELNLIAAATRVRTWIPGVGNTHGIVIPHSEAFSIAELLCARDERGDVAYQPTVHYSYHPTDLALASLHEFVGRDCTALPEEYVLMDEIEGGLDELGVLILREGTNDCYWFGSRLSIHEARNLAPCNNATSLQVVAGVLGAIAWIVENPAGGVVEADDIDHQLILDVARPYLGELRGHRGRFIYAMNDLRADWHFGDLFLHPGNYSTPRHDETIGAKQPVWS
jgi:homospermidine synthase